jgi:hypothetical protein
MSSLSVSGLLLPSPGGNGISGVAAREAIECSSSIVPRGPLDVRDRGDTASSYPGGRVTAAAGGRTGWYLL